ncbi:unnamed protein product [Microthlaspi erraticum]|uniref:Integrase catalytic domain-containing protein n=1 Tax=Microthlaspi erraticum TaxID=1685480 RepID=A0A6D2JQM9_9BRAS|nr:unnamed protein product [Microthlaspi erraticum]
MYHDLKRASGSGWSFAEFTHSRVEVGQDYDGFRGWTTCFEDFRCYWVIVDRLTKSAHFLAIKKTDGAAVLARKFVREIAEMGTKVHLSTAYHPQTDGQSERTIQTLEDLLRMCVLDWGGHWADHLSLVEFAYNNSFQASIGMAPFEALYGRPCRTPLCWTQVGERSMYGATYVQETTEKVRVVRLNMKEAQDRQKSYADRRRRELEFQVGDRVYLKMAMLRGPNRSIAENKLSPRFMGPFPVVERVGPLAYRLELPEIMKAFHKVFHVSMLRKCLHPTEELVARIPEDLQPDLTVPAVPVRILERREKFSLARRTKLRKFGRARRSSRRPKVTILIWKDRYLSHASRRSGMKPFGSTMRPRLIFYRDMSGKRANEAHGGFGVSNGPSSSAKGLDRIEKRPG